MYRSTACLANIALLQTPVWLFPKKTFELPHHPLARQGPSPLQGLKIRFNIFRSSFVSIFLAYIGSSILVPFSVAHNPSTFCTRIRLLHVYPSFSTCRVLTSFPTCTLSLPSTTLVLHMSLASSCFLLLHPHLIHR